MNRTTLSLIAGAAALAAVTGFATVSSPDAGTTDEPARTAARLPVERTSLLCPRPSTSDLAETTYTSFTPVTEGTGKEGRAGLRPATEDPESDDEPVLEPGDPGTPVTGEVSGGSSPALIGTAEGRSAPGWTVQQTTEVTAGSGRGIQGVTCTPADTEFWFTGVSTADGRTDYLHLTNPDDGAAVVDIELYGKDGALPTTVEEGVTVRPHSTEPVLLSTLTEEKQTDVTMHVVVRSGRVGAAVQALDDELGGDWIPASADPAGSLVLPGIPKDATAVRLVAFTPHEEDVDLNIRLASPTGLITPAGHESLHVKGGMTAAVDLGDLTRDEAGSLVLTAPNGSVPVVAAVRVLRGEDDKQESAFIPAARPVGTRATAVENTADGATLSVTAPEGTAKIKVTASAGTEGGEPASKDYTIKSGTTQIIEAPVPSGVKGTYALTITSDATTPVYASRTLTDEVNGVPYFTVQPLTDDRGMVAVPEASEDISVLLK